MRYAAEGEEATVAPIIQSHDCVVPNISARNLDRIPSAGVWRCECNRLYYGTPRPTFDASGDRGTGYGMEFRPMSWEEAEREIGPAPWVDAS